MTSRIHSSTPFAFLLGASLLTIPALSEAQDRRTMRQFGRGRPGVNLVESALQNADEIELTPEQRMRLEDFQAQSGERTASARELIDTWRADLEAERQSDAGDAPVQRRRRGFRGAAGFRSELTSELREAIATLRGEAQASVGELASTVTVEQMRQLQRLTGQRRPAFRRDRARFRGGRFGREGVRGRWGPARMRSFRGGPRAGPAFPRERGFRR